MEYGSAEYFASLQEEHDEEEKAFWDAPEDWEALNCASPFYNNRAGSYPPDGTLRTVASVATNSPGPGGFDWFWAEGDVVPPDGAWDTRSVVRKNGHEWVTISEERATRNEG